MTQTQPPPGLLIPQPPHYNGNDPYLREISGWAARLQQELERWAKLRDTAPEGVFIIENDVETLTLDVSTATLADVANFVATLSDRLRQQGLIR